MTGLGKSVDAAMQEFRMSSLETKVSSPIWTVPRVGDWGGGGEALLKVIYCQAISLGYCYFNVKLSVNLLYIKIFVYKRVLIPG